MGKGENCVRYGRERNKCSLSARKGLSSSWRYATAQGDTPHDVRGASNCFCLPIGPCTHRLDEKVLLVVAAVDNDAGLGAEHGELCQKSEPAREQERQKPSRPAHITSRRQTQCTNFQQRILLGKHPNHWMRSKCLEDRKAPRPTISANHAHGQDRKSCAAQGGNLVSPPLSPAPHQGGCQNPPLHISPLIIPNQRPAP